MRGHVVRSFNPVERGLPAIWLDERFEHMRQAAALIRHLREYPATEGPVDIVIESEGGRCDIGLALYSVLRDEPRPTRVTILRAASMAGIVALAGDHIRIVEDGSVFLHPASFAGAEPVNSDAAPRLPPSTLRALAGRLEAIDALHTAIITRRTRLSPGRIAALSEANTTLDADQAVALGFADEKVRFA